MGYSPFQHWTVGWGHCNTQKHKGVICLFKKGTSHLAVAIKWGPVYLQNPKISIYKFQLRCFQPLQSSKTMDHMDKPPKSQAFLCWLSFVIWHTMGSAKHWWKRYSMRIWLDLVYRLLVLQGWTISLPSSPSSPVASYLTEQGYLRWTNEDPIAFSSSRTAFWHASQGICLKILYRMNLKREKKKEKYCHCSSASLQLLKWLCRWERGREFN